MQHNYQENINIIVARVEAALAARGLNVNDITHFFSKKRTNLKRLLNKKQMFHSVDEVNDIAETLGVSKQWLLHGRGSPEEKTTNDKECTLPVCDYRIKNSGITILCLPFRLNLLRKYRGVIFNRENIFLPEGTLVIYSLDTRETHPGLYMAMDNEYFFPVQQLIEQKTEEKRHNNYDSTSSYKILGGVEMMLPVSSFSMHI